MKKALALALVVIMLLSFAACGGQKNSDTTEKKDSTSTTETNTTTTTTTTATTTTVGQNDPQPSSSQEPVYAKEITIAYNASSINLEPTNGWNSSHNMIKDMVFEGLMYYNIGTGELTNCLATTCEVTDETCTRVHVILRDDVVFSTGDPLTTADVEFSLSKASYAYIANAYDSCDIVSDKEMYINLKAGRAQIIGMLGCGYCGIASKAAAEKNPDGLAIIGTGPYKYDMDTYAVGASLDVVRNELYWGEPAKADVVHFPFMPNAASRAIALENGEVDFAPGLTNEEGNALEGVAGIKLDRFPSINFTYMFFNNYGQVPSQEELEFRYAVIRAINKEEILAAVGDTYGEVAIGCYSKLDPAYIDSEDQFDVDLSYNPEAAKEYVANGGKNSFSCIVAGQRGWCKTSAEVIQEQLRQVGITMEITELDDTSFTNAAKPGTSTFECAVFSNLFSSMPGGGMGFFIPGAANRAQFYTDRTQEIDRNLYMEGDPEIRKQLIQEAQKINHDLVGNVPLFWRESDIAYNEKLGGFIYNAGPMYNFKNVYKIEN